MSASQATQLLMHRLNDNAIPANWDDANTLRRAQIALHRWAELECGDGNGYIQRDEGTGIPRYFNCRARFLSPNDPRAWHRIPDREAGALRRVAAICKALDCHFYHQTDPRGPSLYVSTKRFHRDDHTRNRSHAVGCRRY